MNALLRHALLVAALLAPFGAARHGERRRPPGPRPLRVRDPRLRGRRLDRPRPARRGRLLRQLEPAHVAPAARRRLPGNHGRRTRLRRQHDERGGALPAARGRAAGAARGRALRGRQRHRDGPDARPGDGRLRHAARPALARDAGPPRVPDRDQAVGGALGALARDARDEPALRRALPTRQAAPGLRRRRHAHAGEGRAAAPGTVPRGSPAPECGGVRPVAGRLSGRRWRRSDGRRRDAS